LSVLAEAIDIIKETTGETVDPYRFPLDDAETYALLCRGETKGVFQLEGGGIREMLQRMKPDCFRDIIATLALYRPGPLEGGMTSDYIDIKNGRKTAVFRHPVLEEVLKETHGVMVYQEQIMRILNKLGDIPLPDAYSCIKAISKKVLAKIEQFEGQFIQGAAEKGVTKEDASDLFDMIKVFAGYGFNKSHSTAYALIAYMTAYLKAHHPKEFMAALLCGGMSARNFTQKDSTVEHYEDCERMGITVVPPNVNECESRYVVKDGKIYFALEAIKGVREGLGDQIAQVHKESGPFRDIFDFCTRIPCDARSMEALIKSGAMDVFGCKRSQLMQSVDRALKASRTAIEDRKRGQKSFFDSMEDDTTPQEAAKAANAALPDIPEWEPKEIAEYEKEVLGFYLSSHPLKEHEATFTAYRSHSLNEAVRLPHDTSVILAGMISDIKKGVSKTGKSTPCSHWKTPTAPFAASFGTASSIRPWSNRSRSCSPLAGSTAAAARRTVTMPMRFSMKS